MRYWHCKDFDAKQVATDRSLSLPVKLTGKQGASKFNCESHEFSSKMLYFSS